ncbi:uncharacterized protein LOC128223826 isoform X1 [Mya arenaria]|uniref:uncharacterized protein LOC128223826 isoform X1 n=1 Tax=Mya arenaria TaxID=6604 RepID=UPI0022E8A24A|nr:uncharacterized protein LOC128223826 isoform X1 [Mya arenaria]
MKHKYKYHMLYKDFEEQIREYDIATADITLQCKHFVTKINEHHSMPVESLIHDSKYRDTVRYDADTSSLVFSQQVLEKIMDDFKLSVTECLKCLLKHQTSLICYLQMELCTSSYNFQQRLQQELQYNNGLLGSLACKEEETVVTSDYTIGYVDIIENFNKEQHSELNKTSLCLDNTGEECAIWLFTPLIKKGQQITVSSEFIWFEDITFTSEWNKSSIHKTHVMRSKFPYPRYINEEGCDMAATIQSHPPAEGWPDEVMFKYTLAVTENGPIIRVFDVHAEKTLTAEFTYKLNIEFLKEPSSVAMQSPILAGLQPLSIKRRANHGIGSEPVFKEGRHPEHLRFVDSEGVSRCKAVFHKLIEKGQLLHHGQIFSATIPRASLDMGFTLWRSPLKDPRYINDPDDKCKCVASNFHTYYVQYDKVQQFDVLLIVGGTDIMFKIINRKTGREKVESVDF